jgi:hypothetical protein
VFVFDIANGGSNDSNYSWLEVPTGVVFPTKCELRLAKLGAECNLDTNNGALLHSLPRDDFGGPRALGLKNWRDLDHLSFDFVEMGPLEVDASFLPSFIVPLSSRAGEARVVSFYVLY